MKRFLLYIVALFFALAIFAQDKEIANFIASGDNAFNKYNYYGAAKMYEEALKFNEKMYDVVWKAAESYRLDNDYIRAAKHYRYLADRIPEKYPESVFYYAAMLKANEEFIKAQYFFQKYIEINEVDSLNFNVMQAKNEILHCEFAWKMYNNPNGISLFQCDTNINSVYSDFSTGFLNDSVIVFASIKPIVDSINDYKSRLYKRHFFDSVSQTELFNVFADYNNFDIANPNFTNDGNALYFTMSDFFHGGQTYIYYSVFSGSEWSNPQKLPDKINYPGYNSTHPFIAQRDGKTDVLIWSSDRPGGEGGYDLYFCELLADKSWGFVRNLGRPIFEDTRFLDFFDTTSTVNTRGNEVTPFYDVRDSLLYFSSNWHENMGGYDIFSIKGNFRVWDSLKNLGYPVNSAQNDFYYKIYPDSYVAFLASNRKSSFALEQQSCCNDLFYHKLDVEINEEVVEDQRIELLTTRTKLLVPIALYFHNDEPVPNSWDTVTSLNYSTTYFDYIARKQEYRDRYSYGLPKKDKPIAVDSVDYYFSYFVEENYNKLLQFTSLMKELLESGQKIVVTIKGYTSPLNTVEYNNNLAKRRISSLVNYFYEWENGYFRQFIDSGMIEYEFVAFGKTLSDGKVSDDPNDPRNSIFSPAASRERRIEIIAISVEEIEQSTE